MSTQKHLEYRLVWPNGEVLVPMETQASIGERHEGILDALNGMGVPREYWPTRMARIVTLTQSQWMSATVAQAMFGDDDDDRLDP